MLSANNCYALKTYSGPQAEEYYLQEVEAFNGLAEDFSTYPSSNMVGFHGSYRYKGTFNLLFEFADGGTLEGYFREQQPPKRPSDIIAFWTSLLDVLKALCRLHEQSLSENDPQCHTILQG